MEEVATQTKEKQKVKNPLRNEVVLVKPVPRTNKLFHNQHSANWQYDNTVIMVTVPIDNNTGLLYEPLTEEERKFFEDKNRTDEHGFSFEPGDLSAKKKEDNYWENFEFRLRKTTTGNIKENDVLEKLDLRKSNDYFKYKVLLTNSGPKGWVANGWSNRKDKGTNKIVLVKENESNVERLTRANKLEEANKFFYSINHSADKMYEFLYVFYLESKDYNKPPENAGVDWYKAAIQEIIDTKIEDLLKIIRNEEDYHYKVLIQKAFREGILQFNGPNQIDEKATGKPIGTGINQAVRFLKEDKNQETYLKIKAQLEKDD